METESEESDNTTTVHSYYTQSQILAIQVFLPEIKPDYSASDIYSAVCCVYTVFNL